MGRKEQLKTIIQREQMSEHPQCPACGRNFNMGETAVLAVGDWEGGPRLVHEEDAVFDESGECYVVKKSGGKG